MSDLIIGIILIICTILAIVVVGYNGKDEGLIILGSITGVIGMICLILGTHNVSSRNFTIIDSPVEYTTIVYKDNILYEKNEQYEVILRDGEFNKYKILIDKDDYHYYFEEGKFKTNIDSLKKIVDEFEEIK